MKPHRSITLLDVARLAGVSRATASLVVRGSPSVAAATREKVQRAIAESGYVYDRGAARMRAGKSGIVGLVLPNIANPFFAELLQGFEAVLHQRGLLAFVVNTNDDPETQETVLRRLQEYGCDGSVICPADGASAESLHAAERTGFVVTQCLRSVSERIDYIGPDYADGMRQAAGHLVALGHRRIAFIGAEWCHSAANERRRGLEDYLFSHGLPLARHIPISRDERDPDKRVAYCLAAIGQGVTAALCFNDVIAMQIWSGLSDAGVDVGRAFSVVGFDATMFCDVFRPRLTSVETYPAKIGAEAALQFLGRLKQKEAPISRIVVKTALRVGQTSSAAPLQAPLHA